MKKYNVFYQGELIAEIVDFSKGFIEAVTDMNSEIEIVQVSNPDPNTHSPDGLLVDRSEAENHSPKRIT